MALPLLSAHAIGLMLLALTACEVGSDGGEGEPVQNQREPTAPSYCETHDCSGFPPGYYSINIGGTWFYVPTKDTLKTKVDGQALGAVKVHGKRIYEYPVRSVAGEMGRAESVAFVVPDGRAIQIIPCCDALADFYKLPNGESLRSARLQLGGIPYWQHNWPPKTVVDRELDASEQLNGIFDNVTDGYYIRARVASEEGGGVQMHAWSKGPEFIGERTELICSNHLCDLKWTGEAGSIQGRFVNLQFGSCGASDADCWTQDAVDARFKRIEQYLVQVEAMLQALQTPPF